MDDQQDGCGPSAREGAPDCERGAPHRSIPATGPPPDVPEAALERLELRMRLAELTTVIDTIETALRDARAAGLRVSERHERLAASTAAASRLLRAIAARLR
jgi:hypothetical protein